MPRLTRAVPVCADPFDPAAVSTAISSKSLLIQSKGGGKYKRIRTSADGLQLPFLCTAPHVGQRICVVEKLA